MLAGLHSEKCGGCASLPSYVLKACSRAVASEYDGDLFRMILMKLHDADGPKRRKICRRFVVTSPRDLPVPVECREVLLVQL